MGGRSVPVQADVVVVGGGMAGAIVAGRLTAESGAAVVLLEAGPDYGPRRDGRWPAELLDYTAMPVASHSWGYASAAGNGLPGLALDRARVIGGCTAHNGCAAVWGHRRDYDGWAERGNPGWGMDDLLPVFRRVDRRFRVYTPDRRETTPWHRACLESAPGAGFPVLANLNDVDADLGIAVGPLNVAEGVRWNSAFAYLDPVRDSARLEIVGDALVDRVVIEGDRAVGVEAVVAGRRTLVRAGRVVLCGGAYGSPLVLLRSGVGPAVEVRRLGIAPMCDVGGVGRNLQDHPATRILLEGSDGLRAAMDAFVADGGAPREEGTIVLAKSARCAEAFDLHLYPVASRTPEGWRFAIHTALMAPGSVGGIRLSSSDPEGQPIIDHAYFTDPGDDDLAALVDGVELARRLAAQDPLASLVRAEIEPRLSGAPLSAHIRATGGHDYHPVGTCRMGPEADPDAVVGADGRVHGLRNVHVADAAIMPAVPRANTNIPTAVVAERLVDLWIEDGW